ncbi:hypothetical protein FF1_040719 [Malus domestica]
MSAKEGASTKRGRGKPKVSKSVSRSHKADRQFPGVGSLGSSSLESTPSVLVPTRLCISPPCSNTLLLSRCSRTDIFDFLVDNVPYDEIKEEAVGLGDMFEVTAIWWS